MNIKAGDLVYLLSDEEKIPHISFNRNYNVFSVNGNNITIANDNNQFVDLDSVLFGVVGVGKKAIKHDNNKPDLSIMPYKALVETANAFSIGEKKYGRWNYMEGMEAGRLVAALLRHAYKWNEGEEYDEDGQHHLGAVIANAAMILAQQERGTLIDNRPPKKVNK